MKIIDMRIAKICGYDLGGEGSALFLVPPEAIGNSAGTVAVDMNKVKRITYGDTASLAGLSVPDGYRLAYDASKAPTTSGATFTTVETISGGPDDPVTVKLSTPLHAGDALSIIAP